MKGKDKREKKDCFVYLQCSSGKLSPERREKKIHLEIQQEHFLPNNSSVLDTVLLNKTTQRLTTKIQYIIL